MPYLFLLDMKIPSNYHTLFVKSVATYGLNKKNNINTTSRPIWSTGS